MSSSFYSSLLIITFGAVTSRQLCAGSSRKKERYETSLSTMRKTTFSSATRTKCYLFGHALFFESAPLFDEPLISGSDATGAAETGVSSTSPLLSVEVSSEIRCCDAGISGSVHGYLCQPGRQTNIHSTLLVVTVLHTFP